MKKTTCEPEAQSLVELQNIQGIAFPDQYC